MKLIVGLGNPGEKYLKSRHNIGFMIIDEFARSLKTKFKSDNDLYSGTSTKVGNQDVFLMKPLTYMNGSGEAVSEFLYEFNMDPTDILVITDDFNLPLGTIRLRERGSDGGHNGLANIQYFLQTEEYPRMRIGIGTTEIDKEKYVDFVLGDFSTEEIETINRLMPVFVNCINDFLTKPTLDVMTTFNRLLV